MTRSIAGLQALHQMLYARYIAIRVERVGGKAIRVVTGEHQLEFDIVGVADRLQRLLDAEAARVRRLAGRGLLVLRPVGELAGAEAAHAVDLVGADFERLCRGDEDQRRIRGAQRLGEAGRNPTLRRLAIVRGQIDEAAPRADLKGRDMLA